jgi:hypothetical protein
MIAVLNCTTTNIKKKLNMWVKSDNKVYVNRARGKGDYYKPDIVCNGIKWTTDTLLQQLKNHLTSNKKKPLNEQL